MKKRIFNLSYFAIGVLLFTSCEKESLPSELEVSSFSGGASEAVEESDEIVALGAKYATENKNNSTSLYPVYDDIDE
ncbi:hypothetical protein [Aquimarina sp. RZ0]|uniref:hypothetical protein n=1 Tax=Aquimarina sp. RZ0 TaxID=2607730 RepID=UPI0011F1C3E3|nr:hypothetical protein [Aquimarina sp. RZ0]KAA1246829.1 hypothetical protein F0000_06100 [Aquimarina sp. RZ0]